MNADDLIKRMGTMPSIDVKVIPKRSLAVRMMSAMRWERDLSRRFMKTRLCIEFEKLQTFSISQQYPIKVVYDEVVVGEFFADILVGDRVLVELKAVSGLTQDHVAQALNYLRATGFEVCLLINFGRSKVEIKRLLPHADWREKQI
jgi:GxxExxY protein